MPPQNTNFTRTRFIGIIIGFIFFVIGGWSTIILFPEFRVDMPFYIIPILVIFTLGYIYVFVRMIMDRKWFAKNSEEIEENYNKNALGKVMLVGMNAGTVDIQVFKVIFKKFRLFLPFLISIIAVLAVIFIPLTSGYSGQLLKNLYQTNTNPYISLPSIFIVYSFICCSIFVLGYITLGYILRRKYLNVSESITVIFKRYFKLFWFVILLSITWILMLLLFFSSKKKNALAEISQNASLGILSAFKMFIYINIVRVSLGDEKSGFKDTYEFAKKDIYQLLRVWWGSGLLVGGVWIFGIMFLAIGSKLGIIPDTEAVNNIIAPIFLGYLVFILLFRSFAEQIGLFSVYLKDKNNIDIITVRLFPRGSATMSI